MAKRPSLCVNQFDAMMDFMFTSAGFPTRAGHIDASPPMTSAL